MTVLFNINNIGPSQQEGIARDIGESMYPDLWVGLNFAWVPAFGPQMVIFDHSGKQSYKSLGALFPTELNFARLDGKWGYSTGTANDPTWGPIDDLLSDTNVTFLVGSQKTDTTKRTSAIFSINNSTPGQDCGCHLPWNDGIIYFHFGGKTDGTSRVNTSAHGLGPGSTDVFGHHNWAMRTGRKGMSVWQEATPVCAHGNHVVRVKNSGASLIGGDPIFGADFVDYRHLIIYNRELSDGEIEFLGNDPYAMFRLKTATSFNISTANIFTRSESDLLGISDSVDAAGIFTREVPQSLGITDSVLFNGDFTKSVSQDIGISDAATSVQDISRSLSESISFSDIVREIDEVSTIMTLSQTIVELNVVNDRQTPENVLSFIQTVDTGLFKDIQDPITFVQTLGVIGPINISLTQHAGIRDAVSFCFGAPWAAVELTDTLSFTQVMGIGRPESLTSTLGLTDEAFRILPGNHELNFQQFVSIGKGTSVSDIISFLDTLQTENDFSRSLSDTNFIQDAMAYYIDNPCSKKEYNQFEGEGALSTGIPEKPLTFNAKFSLETLTGPKELLQLRNPETDDRHRIGYTRINRETRGGELSVFSDPIWPEVHTLLFTLTALSDGKGGCPEKINNLLTFFQTNLGKEILLHDWEGISWRGIITTPNEVAVEDRDGWWTISFEFEGSQLDGSQGDQSLAITDTVLLNADWGRSLGHTLGITDDIAVSGILAESLSDDLGISQSISGTRETPVLEDNFSGLVSDPLNITVPDTGTSTWVAHSSYKADGSQTAINSGAYYPFAPSSGTIYHIEWQPRLLSESDGLETTLFLAEGLNASANNEGSTAYGGSDPTTLKAGFVLRKIGANQLNACRMGDNTSGESDTVDFSDVTLKAESNDIDLRLELDTIGGAGNWKVTWFAKDIADSVWVEVRPEIDLLSEDITAVGWANNNTTTTVDLDNISIIEKVNV